MKKNKIFLGHSTVTTCSFITYYWCYRIDRKNDKPKIKNQVFFNYKHYWVL